MNEQNQTMAEVGTALHEALEAEHQARDEAAAQAEQAIQAAMDEEMAKGGPKAPEFLDARGHRIPLGSKVLWAVGGKWDGGGLRWGVVTDLRCGPGGGRPTATVKPAASCGKKTRARGMTIRCDRVFVDYQDHFERLAKGAQEQGKILGDLAVIQRSMAKEVLEVGDGLKALLEEVQAGDANLEDLVEGVTEAVARLVPERPDEPDDAKAAEAVKADAVRLGLIPEASDG